MNAQDRIAAIGLDPSFGEGGILNFELPGRSYRATIRVTPSKKIVALGMIPEDDHTVVLARFEQNGSLDRSFGQEGVATVELSPELIYQTDDCVVLSDERVVFVGTRSLPGYMPQDYFFTCVKADGTLDTDFGNGGTTVVAPFGRHFHVYGALPHIDGKILAFFEGFYMPEGDRANAFVRLDPSGQFDPSFGTQGVLFLQRGTRSFNPVARPDGRLLLSSSVNSVSVVRGFDAAGQPDLSFGEDGIAQLPLLSGATLSTEELALQDDGRIVVRGVLNEASGNSQSYLIRLRPDGKPDPTFNRGELLVLPRIGARGVVVEPADRVLALERDYSTSTVQLRSLMSTGFEEGLFQLPLPGPVYHYPEELLLAHLPGTVLVSANVTDTETQVTRLTISRLLI